MYPFRDNLMVKIGWLSYHRILQVARTIADLDDSDTIQTAHLSEAIGYRMLDREG